MLPGMKPLGRLGRSFAIWTADLSPGRNEVTNERGVPIYAIYIRADQSNDPSAN
jgi:hypothetical protein